jgi:hypothetical protein
MDRTQLLRLLAGARKALVDCDGLLAVERQKLRKLGLEGEQNEKFQVGLLQLEAECERHLIEMERLLDELDRITVSDFTPPTQ